MVNLLEKICNDAVIHIISDFYTSTDVMVGYEHTSYTLSEVKDHEELCVTSLSPGIDEMFTINVET